MTEKCKQAIVVRCDLGMSVGKTAAQVAHAAVGAAFVAQEDRPEWLRLWLDEGMIKVVLSADSAERLAELAAAADAAGLPSCAIRDAGRTEVEPGTPTCLAVGPAPRKAVDRIVGALPLLRRDVVP